jgi:hypothetical protein
MEARREESLYTLDDPPITESQEYIVEQPSPNASTNLFDFTLDQKSWYQDYFMGKRRF